MTSLPWAGSWPITQRFGSNAGAYARFGLRGHNGLDVGLPSGTRLLAPRAGTVTERRNDPTGYGQYAVVTDADGGEWLLGHGSAWVVKAGQRIAEGQYLGKSGSTGNSTGPHLHLGYRPFGYDRSNGYSGYINPRPFLPLAYRVALQTGHAPDGGGAPGEATWTPKLAARLAHLLTAAGVAVTISGGFYNRPPPADVAADYDLFLSLHYDAAVYGATTGDSGCCAARGAAETEWWEADRFLAEWLRTYPAATGVPLRQERVNPNMTQYYAWRHLSYVTPGALLEHGVGAPGVGLDADTLWTRMGAVAAADALAALRYLHVTPPMEPEIMGMLSEAELLEVINKGWGELRGVPCNPETAIYKSYVERLRAKDYKGLPIRGEMPVTFGTSQWFDAGVAVYRERDAAVTWEG